MSQAVTPGRQRTPNTGKKISQSWLCHKVAFKWRGLIIRRISQWKRYMFYSSGGFPETLWFWNVPVSIDCRAVLVHSSTSDLSNCSWTQSGIFTKFCTRINIEKVLTCRFPLIEAKLRSNKEYLSSINGTDNNSQTYELCFDQIKHTQCQYKDLPKE